LQRRGARVCKGTSRRQPDVTITTDSATWLTLREGKLSGIEAFQQRRLTVWGNLDYAVAFEALFTLPGGRPPLLRIEEVQVNRHRISTLTMPEPDVNAVYAHLLDVMQDTLDALASERRLPLIG
jgi:hypothetical protein